MPALAVRVSQALAAWDLYMPPTEADIKTHTIRHVCANLLENGEKMRRFNVECKLECKLECLPGRMGGGFQGGLYGLLIHCVEFARASHGPC